MELLLRSSQYERLFDGAVLTVQLLGNAFLLGLVLSLVFGIARLSSHAWIRGAALVFVEFARGISSIILLFIMAYAIPILLGLPQRDLMLLASIALGVNMGGYGAEIIRGAILSVPKGQTEASIALNLSEAQRLRHVVLPQALRVILPPMGNLTIEILKGTSLVYLIGLADLLGVTQRMRTSRVVSEAPAGSTTLFLNALLIYFVLAQLINLAFRFAERRVERRFVGTGGEPTTLTEADALKVAK
ncbi:amino acid ABC transporter permease [Egicoccus sp. AB-alg6-2]|uniref:amino acid ABC transporter permease n=1 Tax=Egicoccus sp. AB-alg6-2 TaxID=3242692 RepID=UPI00359D1493